MILRENRAKLYVIQNNNIHHYAGIKKIKQGALLSLDAQYIICGIRDQDYDNMIRKRDEVHC